MPGGDQARRGPSTWMPVMRSRVRTGGRCGANRSCGTGKPGRLAKFSGEFGGGGGLEAQIHFDRDPGFGRVRTTSTGLQPAQRRLRCARPAARASEEIEIAARRPVDSGAQHLDRDLASPSRRDARNEPARSRRRRPACRRSSKRDLRPGARARRHDRARFGRRERRQLVLQARSGRRRSPSPTRSARVDRNWPSLMKLGPSSCSASASRLPRANRCPMSRGVRSPAGQQSAARRPLLVQRRRRRREVEREQRVVAREACGRSRDSRRRMGKDRAAIRSEPPGGMQRGDAAGQIAIGHAAPSPPSRDHAREIAPGRRKSADAFDQIAIGLRVAGDHGRCSGRTWKE